eukprot:TRINITY_DN7966_c0_g1_i1.p3 TRINITY_DN7966_c0_g1~~TRINITY_DN7966_c0_g1_i1.p3  ORF type:complete len:153 (+),score=59.57 TRINITY_DN7966_c0_g1_i1:52-510(+)
MKAVLLALAMLAVVEAKPGFGFGDHFGWVGLTEGLKQAKETGKPIMVLHHREWCGACKALSKSFVDSKTLLTQSKSFVMVNCNDDAEGCDGDIHKPDGKGYFPRAFFMKPDGELLKDVGAPNGHPDYKYYYSTPKQIEDSMTNVLGLLDGEL